MHWSFEDDLRSGLVMAAGLSRLEKSREGPGTGQDLETLKVPWSRGPGTKEVQKSRGLFLKVPGHPGPFFFTNKDHQKGSPLRFTTKVHH